MVFQSRKNGVKSPLHIERSQLSPQAKIKKSEAVVDLPFFFHSAKTVSVYRNLIIKKLNSTERGALFRHFCVSKVITTAHAHKSGVIFHFFFQELSNKKYKKLRPKKTKIASRTPFEANLVIFGRRASIFFCLKALGKKWKTTPLLCACAVVITLETQKCWKRAPRSAEFSFLLIVIDRNGFRRMKEEGQTYKILP